MIHDKTCMDTIVVSRIFDFFHSFHIFVNVLEEIQLTLHYLASFFYLTTYISKFLAHLHSYLRSVASFFGFRLPFSYIIKNHSLDDRRHLRQRKVILREQRHLLKNKIISKLKRIFKIEIRTNLRIFDKSEYQQHDSTSPLQDHNALLNEEPYDHQTRQLRKEISIN